MPRLLVLLGLLLTACSSAPGPSAAPTAAATNVPTTGPTAAQTSVPTLAPSVVATPLPAPTAVATSAPTVTAPLVPTTAAKAPPATDYVKLRQDLMTPLGVLIVAVREKSPTADERLAAFNEAAGRVEPAIQGDLSINANRLHSAIVNVRGAAARKDLATLERERAGLLEVR